MSADTIRPEAHCLAEPGTRVAPAATAGSGAQAPSGLYRYGDDFFESALRLRSAYTANRFPERFAEGQN